MPSPTSHHHHHHHPVLIASFSFSAQNAELTQAYPNPTSHPFPVRVPANPNHPHLEQVLYHIPGYRYPHTLDWLAKYTTADEAAIIREFENIKAKNFADRAFETEMVWPVAASFCSSFAPGGPLGEKQGVDGSLGGWGVYVSDLVVMGFEWVVRRMNFPVPTLTALDTTLSAQDPAPIQPTRRMPGGWVDLEPSALVKPATSRGRGWGNCPRSRTTTVPNASAEAQSDTEPDTDTEQYLPSAAFKENLYPKLQPIVGNAYAFIMSSTGNLGPITGAFETHLMTKAGLTRPPAYILATALQIGGRIPENGVLVQWVGDRWVVKYSFEDGYEERANRPSADIPSTDEGMQIQNQASEIKTSKGRMFARQSFPPVWQTGRTTRKRRRRDPLGALHSSPIRKRWCKDKGAQPRAGRVAQGNSVAREGV
ncbi:hypothetical protein P154DRAFT_607721 [Amniculicola lignicola CBS 123094]|uniref:Uncharacterized protein n=1 Tax=Amniculicola lignicola CBS 123094 TaxID=1392246 RepID=A0A6A5W6T1_9PLEO|nr:hypothetical protein P154DRAFT_607721 [Amniculicola lignicola CBS 123094]